MDLYRIPYFLALLEALLVTVFVSFTAFEGTSRPIIFSNVFYFSALSCGLIIGWGEKKHKILKDIITPIIIIMSLILNIGTTATACDFSINTDLNSLANGTIKLNHGFYRVAITENYNSIEWFKAQGGIFCFLSAWDGLILVFVIVQVFHLWRQPGTIHGCPKICRGILRFEKVEKTNREILPMPIIVCVFLIFICVTVELLISLLCLITHVPILSDIESPNYLSIILTVIVISKAVRIKPILNLKERFMTLIAIMLKMYALILSTYSISALTNNGNENDIKLMSIHMKENLENKFSINLGGYKYVEIPETSYYKNWFSTLTSISYAIYLSNLIFSYILLVLTLLNSIKLNNISFRNLLKRKSKSSKTSSEIENKKEEVTKTKPKKRTKGESKIVAEGI
jgi:hypothetical protein